jgi:2-hydroxy-3-keto-5-methylthiopentenyl-1-phosphate phosphatase
VHVYCDFDGTVSVQDATDFVLSRLADPEWRAIEQLWQDGKIGSGECMRRQISLLRATRRELDEVLCDVDVDPFFPSFIDFCAVRGVPVTIVSDGVDYFIKRILQKRGLSHLPIIANRLVVTSRGGQSSYRLLSPHADPGCATTAGVCKCRSLNPHGQRIYVGDGRSDFCVSAKPEFVFAKGELADHCTERNVRYFAYCDFSDVTSILQHAVPYFQNQPATPSHHVAA